MLKTITSFTYKLVLYFFLQPEMMLKVFKAVEDAISKNHVVRRGRDKNHLLNKFHLIRY